MCEAEGTEDDLSTQHLLVQRRCCPLFEIQLGLQASVSHMKAHIFLDKHTKKLIFWTVKLVLVNANVISHLH